jgi:Zn-dependent protease/antitoxin (DNA-binding transcriptional repressor) of toxin-antitoxin stability system
VLRIGTIAGSPVLVSPSWFLVAGLIAYVMAPSVDDVQPGLGGWKYVVGLAFAVALYGAVLLHEASHALVARRLGYRVQSITLHFLGGATAIDRDSDTAGKEFWIAVVGPITSLAVGGAALALDLVMSDGLLRLVVDGLALSNLYIGVLNLVPALPLDGGRVLKSAVWAVSGRASLGSQVAGWAGRVLAIVLVAVAAYVAYVVKGDIFMVLIWVLMAGFLWSGASQSISVGRIQDRLSAIQVRALARRTLGVPEDLPLAEAVRRAQEVQAGSIVTLTSDGRPVGVVDERAVAALPADRRPWVPTSTVTRRLEPGLTLPADISGSALLTALRTTPASEYVLLDESGGVFGVLATADVARQLR